MFIVFLKFGSQRARAKELMAGHLAWIDAGIADGVIVLAGSLTGKKGGALVVRGIKLVDLERLLRKDPFVEQGVVTTEIVELSAHKAHEELSFLLC